MHPKTFHFLIRVVMIFFVGLLAAPFCYSQGELAQDCDGQVSRQPPNVSLSCSGWFIRLYTKSGKKWGRISGKTREAVLQELKRDRKVDHIAFPNLQSDPNHLSYDYPSEPICEMCDPRATTATPAVCSHTSIFGVPNFTVNPDGSIVHNAEYFCQGAIAAVREWGAKVWKTLPGFLGKLERPNPFGGVMSVFGPYLKGLGDVMRRVNDLNEKLKTATDLTEIADGIRELEREGSTLERSYNSLPRDARDWLDGVPSFAGLWIGPIWPGDSQPQGMQIIQSGDSFKAYLPGTTNLLFEGTLNGNEFTTPANRMPTELSASDVKNCGLSSNVLYTNVSMRARVSEDGKSLTLEQVTEKVTVGNCVFGGVLDRGTWYRK
jgi:hypothetical protein